MVVMLFSLSIADGIAIGFIAYTVLGVARGRAREIHWIVYVVSALAVLRYAVRPMV